MSSKYNNNKKHGNVFKNWLCPSFLLLPKKSELPKVWGGCSPPRPPGPYAYAQIFLRFPLRQSVYLASQMRIKELVIRMLVSSFTRVTANQSGKPPMAPVVRVDI